MDTTDDPRLFQVWLTADELGNTMSALEDYIVSLSKDDRGEPEMIESARSAYDSVSDAAQGAILR